MTSGEKCPEDLASDPDYKMFLEAWREKGLDPNLYRDAIQQFPYLKGKKMLSYAAALLLASKGMPEIFSGMFDGHRRIVEEQKQAVDGAQESEKVAKNKAGGYKKRMLSAESKLRFVEGENKRLLIALQAANDDDDEEEGPPTKRSNLSLPSGEDPPVGCRPDDAEIKCLSGDMKVPREIIDIDSDDSTDPSGLCTPPEDRLGEFDKENASAKNAEKEPSETEQEHGGYLETQALF
jgi:hypothetical protein